MTLPSSPTGFPDWQRNAPAQTTTFVQINQAFAGPTNLGPYNCSSFPATRIALEATNKNLSLILFWFADKALTQPLGQQELVTQTNALIDTAVSNQGPWLLIELTAQTYPATVTFQASAVAYVGNGLGLVASNILIARENAAVAAAGTLSIFSTQIYPGPATINVQGNAGPFTVSLAAIDIGGARLPLYQKIIPAAGNLSDLVYLPATVIRIIVTNSSAGASTYSAYVVGDPSTRPVR